MKNRFFDYVNEEISKLSPELQGLITYDKTFPKSPIFVAKGTFINDEVIPLFRLGEYYFCIKDEQIVYVGTSMKVMLIGYKMTPMTDEEKAQAIEQYKELIDNNKHIHEINELCWEQLDNLKEDVYKITQKHI